MIKLINFLPRHTVVTSEALGTCVSDLPRIATRQCGGGWELNPQSVDCKSSVLTTTLASHKGGFSGNDGGSRSPTAYFIIVNVIYHCYDCLSPAYKPVFSKFATGVDIALKS